MTISSCPLTGLTLPIPRYVTPGTSRGLGILRLAGLRSVPPLSVWVAGGAGGVSAPAGGGPCHVAGLGLGEGPAGGLLGAVVMAADRGMPFKTTHVATTDARLTRECERIRQDQRAGTITSAEAAR